MVKNKLFTLRPPSTTPRVVSLAVKQRRYRAAFERLEKRNYVAARLAATQPKIDKCFN
jgi:hypothetical protein